MVKCSGTILAQKQLLLRTDPRCVIQSLFSAIANLLVEKICLRLSWFLKEVAGPLANIHKSQHQRNFNEYPYNCR